MKPFPFLLLILAVLVSGCRSEQRQFLHRMEGSWTIVQEDSHIIQPDGSRTEVQSSSDIGTLIISPSDFEDGVFMEYSLNFSSSGFSRSNQPFKTDEGRKRVFLYYFFCDDLFGCDWVGTIEEDQPRRQVWTFFRRRGNSTHQVYTWTLEKD